MLYQDVVAAQTTTPAIYGQQGQVTNSTANIVPVSIPELPTSISADKLNLQPDLSKGLSSPNYSTGGADALMAGADIYSKLLVPTSASYTENTTQANTINNRINELIGLETGKGAEQSSLEQQAGLPDQNKQLANLQGQILVGNAEYAKMNDAFLKAYTDAEARGAANGVPTIAYQGEQAAIQKQQAVAQMQKASDINLIIAKANMLQGNITASQNNINRAIDLKYRAYETELTARQNQLTDIRGQLDKEQKIRADAMQLAIADQKTALEEKKTKEKDNLNTALVAGIQTKFVNKNGEFFNTANGEAYSTPQDFFKAAGVTSFEQAYQQGLVTDLNNAKMQDINTIQQIIAKYSDSGVTVRDTIDQAKAKLAKTPSYIKDNYIAPSPNYITPSNVSTVGGNGVLIGGIKIDPKIAGDVGDVLSGRNTLYNIRQTMGRTNAAAAYMERMRNAIRSVDPNFDFVASDAGAKFVSSTFYQKAVSAITSVMPNIDTVVKLSNQVSRIGVKGVDALLQKGAIQIGNTKVANFHEAQKLIADEIGLALGQGTVSDMKLQLGFDVTDPSVTPEVFASNMAVVKEFITNRKNALEDQRYSSSVVTNSSQTLESLAASKGFDLKGARDAGYSDDEIRQLLTQ
jgi:hypothetical protein